VEVLPGIPDRLLAITQHLSPSGNDISHLIVFHPLDKLPLCWQQILHTLEQTGTTVTAKDISPARAGGDLAAARQDEFQPKVDGSLQLLRPSNPSTAAQEVAAWLSGLDRLDQTVIIGPDSSWTRLCTVSACPLLEPESRSTTTPCSRSCH
jgi:hypothetical protein